MRVSSRGVDGMGGVGGQSRCLSATGGFWQLRRLECGLAVVSSWGSVLMMSIDLAAQPGDAREVGALDTRESLKMR